MEEFGRHNSRLVTLDLDKVDDFLNKPKCKNNLGKFIAYDLNAFAIRFPYIRTCLHEEGIYKNE